MSVLTTFTVLRIYRYFHQTLNHITLHTENGLQGGGNGAILYQRISTLHMIILVRIVLKDKVATYGSWQVHMDILLNVCGPVPAGKAILFPILNSECSFAEFPKLKTLSELRMCAKTIQDQATTLMASVDGVPILNLQEYRIQSPPFNFTLPHNNILGMPANTTTEAVADGNWVFLKPLSPGVHKIMFKGEVQQPKIKGTSIVSSSSFAFPSGWDFRAIYDLRVKSA